MIMNDEEIIEEVRHKLKASDTIKSLFKEYNIDLIELDFFPIVFSKTLDVSARTEHGIIYLNDKLKETLDDIPHYVAHEITHVLQQTTGSKPTKGSNDNDYLDNEFEIEGFQQQSKFISETEGKDEAEDYINKVLDHHAVSDKKFDLKKDELLAEASKQLNLFEKQKSKEMPKSEFKEKLDELISTLDDEEKEIPYSKHIRVTKLPEFDKNYRLRKLKEILDAIKDQ